MRTTLGGVSLLLAVALVLQASAGWSEIRTTIPGGSHDGPDVRQVTHVQVRRAIRATRRQNERPVQVLVAADRSRADRAFLAVPSRPQTHAVLRQPVWLTDLPPPAKV